MQPLASVLLLWLVRWFAMRELSQAETAFYALVCSTALSPTGLHRFIRSTQPSSWQDILDWPEVSLRKHGLLQQKKHYEGNKVLRVRAEQLFAQCLKTKVELVPYISSDYPAILKTIALPPLVLYYKGKLPRFAYETEHVVSIVGTRRAEAFINEFTHKLAAAIVSHGGHVVSGMALGVDTAAHRGALAHKTAVYGGTTAVVASGVDHIYPYANRRLYAQILEHGGCILSEHPPGVEPYAFHFPTRNRIIAGLAREVFVAQAGIKSGALITAQYAIDCGRDVYTYSVETVSALPEAYAGNFKLAEEGAHTIRKISAFLEHTGLNQSQTHAAPQKSIPLHLTPQAAATNRFTAAVLEGTLEQRILGEVQSFPVSLSQLARTLDIAETMLAPLLMELILDGKLREVTPNRYIQQR